MEREERERGGGRESSFDTHEHESVEVVAVSGKREREMCEVVARRRKGKRERRDIHVSMLPLPVLVEEILGHGDLRTIEDRRLCRTQRKKKVSARLVSFPFLHSTENEPFMSFQMNRFFAEFYFIRRKMKRRVSLSSSFLLSSRRRWKGWKGSGLTVHFSNLNNPLHHAQLFSWKKSTHTELPVQHHPS